MQLLQMETQNMSAAASARVAAKHSLKVLSRLYEQLGSYDDAVITHCVMASAVTAFFGNTGPTGQRVIAAAQKKLKADALSGLPRDVADASLAYGEALTAAIIEWSMDDGGAVIKNMGFPMAYDLATQPDSWAPTSAIRQQQFPLLPDWGSNRTFAMPDGTACPLPPPPVYSEDPGSSFYGEAREVYETIRNLTPEQEAIARFWSDDPMLSPTPPGHSLPPYRRGSTPGAHNPHAT